MQKEISIIIPVLDEEKYIDHCLSSLMVVDFPQEDIEIILVDNGSVDKTLEIAGRYEKVLILQVPNVNISTLRNIGAKKAKGDILAFLDGDCMVQKDWPRNCLDNFKRSDVAIIGADPMIPSGSSWVARTWSINFPYPEEAREVEWVASHNLITRKDIFNQLNGFREDLIVSEDVDFCQRAKRNNFKIISDPKIAVIHLKNPDTIWAFFKKELWRGKGMVTLFLNNLPKVNGAKPLFYGLVMLLFLAWVVTGTIFAILKCEIMCFLLAMFVFWVGPVWLATKGVIRSRRFNYFIKSIPLFAVYGIARGLAAINPRNWRMKQL